MPFLGTGLVRNSAVFYWVLVIKCCKAIFVFDVTLIIDPAHMPVVDEFNFQFWHRAAFQTNLRPKPTGTVPGVNRHFSISEQQSKGHVTLVSRQCNFKLLNGCFGPSSWDVNAFCKIGDHLSAVAVGANEKRWHIQKKPEWHSILISDWDGTNLV